MIRTFPDDAAILELLTTLRILHALGYISPHAEYQQYLDADTLADVDRVVLKKALIQRVIEEAYSVSQL